MNAKNLPLFVLALLAIVPAAIAGSFDILRVDHIRMPYYSVYSGQFPLRVEVANEGFRDAEDVHVRSWIPDFDYRSVGGIEKVSGFSSGQNLLQDASDVPPGEYWVRITVSNDDERRVKHRLVWIE